jgi:hypothetical protein
VACHRHLHPVPSISRVAVHINPNLPSLPRAFAPGSLNFPGGCPHQSAPSHVACHRHLHPVPSISRVAIHINPHLPMWLATGICTRFPQFPGWLSTSIRTFPCGFTIASLFIAAKPPAPSAPPSFV